MTDKEFMALKARIEKAIQQWKPIVGWFRITSVFDRTTGNAECESVQAAKADTQWAYKETCITWRMPNLLTMNDDDLEFTILHELCHALINEMRDYDKDSGHEERVVTDVAHALIWAKGK